MAFSNWGLPDAHPLLFAESGKNANTTFTGRPMTPPFQSARCGSRAEGTCSERGRAVATSVHPRTVFY